MLRQTGIMLISTAALMGVSLHAVAQQPESHGVTNASIHDIVRDIRQYESWKILQFYDKEDASGYQYFRFKLERKDGKLVIIDVDPADPDLKALTR